MKKKILAVLTAAIVMAGSAVAQPQRPDGGKREKPTPEQIAKRYTDRMTNDLNLTQEQAQKLYQINLTKVQQMQQKAEARKAEMAAERQKSEAEMKELLTPEQYQKWSEMRAKSRNCGKAKGQNGKWRGHGPRRGNGQGCNGEGPACGKDGKGGHRGKGMHKKGADGGQQ